MIVYKGRLLKKIFKLKINACPVKAGDYMACKNIAFHLLPIWLQTLVAINSESRLTLFTSFCVPPSEVAMLFDSNLSRRPFLRKVVDLDLLLFTEFNLNAVLFICHISTQSLTTDRMIEQSNGRCFGRQRLLADSIENFISHEKKSASSSPKFAKH